MVGMTVGVADGSGVSVGRGVAVAVAVGGTGVAVGVGGVGVSVTTGGSGVAVGGAGVGVGSGWRSSRTRTGNVWVAVEPFGAVAVTVISACPPLIPSTRAVVPMILALAMTVRLDSTVYVSSMFPPVVKASLKRAVLEPSAGTWVNPGLQFGFAARDTSTLILRCTVTITVLVPDTNPTRVSCTWLSLTLTL